MAEADPTVPAGLVSLLMLLISVGIFGWVRTLLFGLVPALLFGVVFFLGAARAIPPIPMPQSMPQSMPPQEAPPAPTAPGPPQPMI